MKQIYAVLVATCFGLTAVAAPLQVKNRPIVSATPQLYKSLDVALKATDLSKTNDFVKASSRAVNSRSVSADQIYGDYEITYQALLSNMSSGTETGSIYYDEDYDETELDIPSASGIYNIPFGGEYNEETGELTIKAMIWGQAGSNYIAQYPLNGTSTTASITLKYNEDTKSFDIPTGAGLCIAVLNASRQIQGYNWAASLTEIVAPDGDYALKVSKDSECNSTNVHSYSVTKGSDIETVYVFEVEGDEKAADWSTYFEDTFFKDYGDLVTSYDTDIAITLGDDMTESGYYTLMFGAYDKDGNLRKQTQIAYFVNIPDDSYQTIATITYEDGIVSQVYNNFNHTNDAIELQENVNTPGLYRLVDAYEGQARVHADDCSHYIYIDAQDPEFVNIPLSSTGLDFGYGLLTIGTFGGALGYSKDQCKQNGYAVGTLEGRTITLPVRSILTHEQLYNEPGSWSYANTTSEVTFVLPDITLEVTVVDQAENPVENATVETEGVTATTDASGKAELTLPATTDYLQTVSVKVTPEDENIKETSSDVKLNGATNTAEITVDTTTGISGIETDASVEYYNLQGVKVDNPSNGQIVIKKEGNSVSKVFVR